VERPGGSAEGRATHHLGRPLVVGGAGLRKASAPLHPPYQTGVSLGRHINTRRPRGGLSMLEEFLNEKVVIDLKSPFVCLGTLSRIEEHFLELKGADLHDLRDTDTTRENYVAASERTGIKRNRKKVVLFRNDVVAISRLGDVSDQ
jgi:hypothetical protein